IDQDDDGTVDLRSGCAGPGMAGTRRGTGTVVAILADIELAQRRLPDAELRQDLAEGPRHRHAAAPHRGQHHALETGMALDQLVGQPPQGGGQRGGVEELATPGNALVDDGHDSSISSRAMRTTTPLRAWRK